MGFRMRRPRARHTARLRRRFLFPVVQSGSAYRLPELARIERTEPDRSGLIIRVFGFYLPRAGHRQSRRGHPLFHGRRGRRSTRAGQCRPACPRRRRHRHHRPPSPARQRARLVDASGSGAATSGQALNLRLRRVPFETLSDGRAYRSAFVTALSRLSTPGPLRPLPNGALISVPGEAKSGTIGAGLKMAAPVVVRCSERGAGKWARFLVLAAPTIRG
jgi:hypothetical protein